MSILASAANHPFLAAEIRVHGGHADPGRLCDGVHGGPAVAPCHEQGPCGHQHVHPAFLFLTVSEGSGHAGVPAVGSNFIDILNFYCFVDIRVLFCHNSWEEGLRMSARTGAEYLNGLKDCRAVWVDGQAVTDVTAHPGFRGSLAGMAGYFDWQHRYPDDCLMEGEDGSPTSVSHLIPRSPGGSRTAPPGPRASGPLQRRYARTHARLRERDLRRLCRSAGSLADRGQ